MIDITTEAVEARAKWHDYEAGAWRSDGGNIALARIHDEHAATLRVLAAERDTFQEAHKGVFAMVDKVIAQRDAALAREALLREAVEEAIEFAENDVGALTPSGKTLLDRWRAALASEVPT